MDTEKMRSVVNNLNDKATETPDGTEAMKFSQAALNAANAYCSLAEAICRVPGGS